MNVSRRRLLQVLPAVGVAAIPVVAQQPPAANSDADLEAARASQLSAAQAVWRVRLPQSTEPATRFVPRG